MVDLELAVEVEVLEQIFSLASPLLRVTVADKVLENEFVLLFVTCCNMFIHNAQNLELINMFNHNNFDFTLASQRLLAFNISYIFQSK